MAKRRILYCFLLFGAFAFYLFIVDYISFFVFLFFLCLPFFSLAVALANGIHATLSIKGENDAVFQKEPVFLSASVKGRFFFYAPKSLVRLSFYNCRTNLGTNKTFFLSETGRKCRLSFSSQWCGFIRVQVKKACILDPLGLFSFSMKLPASSFTFPVLPVIRLMEVPKVSPSLPGYDSQLFSPSHPGDDPSELFDIRSWREGDPLNRIHHKLSSRLGELMVKELGLPINVNILVIAEPNGGPEENDDLLNLCASLSYSMAEKEQNHLLFWYDEEGKQSSQAFVLSEEGCFEALYALLSVYSPASQNPALLSVCHEEEKKQYAHVFYLCSRPNSDSMEALRERFPTAFLHVFLTSPLEPASPLWNMADSFLIHLETTKKEA